HRGPGRGPAGQQGRGQRTPGHAATGAAYDHPAPRGSVSGPTARTLAMRAWILEQLPRLVPGLNNDDVPAVLVAAGAWHQRPLLELHGHLRAHPDALTEAHPDPPLALIRLAHV